MWYDFSPIIAFYTCNKRSLTSKQYGTNFFVYFSYRLSLGFGSSEILIKTKFIRGFHTCSNNNKYLSLHRILCIMNFEIFISWIVSFIKDLRHAKEVLQDVRAQFHHNILNFPFKVASDLHLHLTSTSVKSFAYEATSNIECTKVNNIDRLREQIYVILKLNSPCTNLYRSARFEFLM